MRSWMHHVVIGLVVLTTATAAGAQQDMHFDVSPFGGVGIFDKSTGLKTDAVFGARLGFFPLPWLGLEGTWGVTPTSSDTNPNDEIRVHQVWGDLLLQAKTDGRWIPYVTGGWSEMYLNSNQASTVSDFNGWQFGAGMKIRIGSTDRQDYHLRLDLRDVMAKFDQAGEGATHNFLATAGLSVGIGTSRADRDLDGVPDRTDDCPDTPATALVDATGCPLDGDQDEVFDGIDACPDTPVGAWVDAVGCPADQDADTVYDGIDVCADTPAGANVDATGCPLDTDADGVADGIDTCPDTPAGVTVDATGCATDEDGDGVFDGPDLCPGTPAGVEVDADGCPIPTSQKEIELLDTGTLSMENVFFESGSAELKVQSFEALNEVSEILAKWPQLAIEVGGHTDSQGADSFNAELSRKRAQSVLDYITMRAPNIRVGQFTVVGYGEAQPVADNANAAGRARNRRVEFKVLNRGVLSR